MPRVNPVMLLIARVVGLFAVVGVIHGVIMALSGFSGHYGAYPRDELIMKSLLVGVGIAALNIFVGGVFWRLFGTKRIEKCDHCSAE